MTYEVLAYDHRERAKLDLRLREALREAKVAVPYWGKGVPIASAVAEGATTITLDRAGHGFSSGDYLLIQSSVPAEFDNWDLLHLSGVASEVLSLPVGLVHAYDAGTRCWPILYGRPGPKPFRPLNLGRGRYEVSVLNDARTF